ncbi:hypothetical protein GCG54_00001795 [Colletotrichum gloeosporioides]|uniref:Uncharacterized protein n=1 Tax=Colletotrichum gloeosporioides TaxID=474922 RepID=A0A8H4CWW5_COLGL|nr:uncharacterized protein GCG54_00001795 [Colletotrichum gloeosporioides]KAF3811469.1 hypothetical protein GCG54_00001795 [Colletotrichum gloeosporioides]
MTAHYNQNISREIGLLFFHMSHHLLLTKFLGLHPLLDLETAENFMSDMHETERKSGNRWNKVAAQLREALDGQVASEVGEDIICNERLVKRNTDMIASKLADNYWKILAHAEKQVLELCAAKTGVTFMEILDAHTKAFKDRDRDAFQVVKRIGKKHRETVMMFKHASDSSKSHNIKLANKPNEDDVTLNHQPSTHNLKIVNTLIDRLSAMRKEQGLEALAMRCAKSTTIGILVAWGVDSIYIEEDHLAVSLEKIRLLYQIGHQRIIQHCKEKVQVFSEERSRGGQPVTCSQLVQYTIQICGNMERQTAQDNGRIHSDIVSDGLGWSKVTKNQDQVTVPDRDVSGTVATGREECQETACGSAFAYSWP